jgi:hypothetical protein
MMSSRVFQKISSVSVALGVVIMMMPPSVAFAEAKDPLNLDNILNAFGRMDGLEAEFREEKHLALLSAPLVTTGRLYFTRPGYLARLVEKPSKSKVLITPTTVEMTDATGSQTIDLRARPDVKTFVESFTRVLAGDRAGLETVYTLAITHPGDALPFDSWILTMTPKGKPLNQLIASLEVRGRGIAVNTITVREHAGDHSVITITKANPERVFTAAEQTQLFGEPRPSATP